MRTKPSIAGEIDTHMVEHDKKFDGMYPLLTNYRFLSLRQVLEAHKRQVGLKRRFRKRKSAHEIATISLHNESRIVALFVLYFVALIAEALSQREIRLVMRLSGLQALPLHLEQRESKLMTT